MPAVPVCRAGNRADKQATVAIAQRPSCGSTGAALVLTGFLNDSRKPILAQAAAVSVLQTDATHGFLVSARFIADRNKK
jgi:hypothetical protein